MLIPGSFAWIAEREELSVIELDSKTVIRVNSAAPMRQGRNRFEIGGETIEASMPIESTAFQGGDLVP